MKSTVIKTCQCKDHIGPKDISLSDFHRNKTKVDGHNGICKECQKRVDSQK